MKMDLIAHTVEETQAIASRLAQHLQAGDVLLLQGELGAGKTTFTKGLAVGLGITRNVKSPTYTLIREYTEGRLPLYHMDVYRLEESGTADLGLEEYFDGDGVCVVEWPQFAAEDLPTEFLAISFQKNAEHDEERMLSLTAHGSRYLELLATLKA